MDKYNFSDNREINSMLNQVVGRINSFAQRQIDHINRLTKIGSALSPETDVPSIMNLILEEAIDYTNADGATIYTVSKDKKSLEFEIVYNRTLGIREGGKWGEVSFGFSLPLYDEKKRKRLKNLVTYVYHTKKEQVLDDVYEQDIFDNSGTKKADQANNYRSKSMIAIPLKNHEDDVLGIIQLINSMSESGKIQSFTKEHTAMLNSLASQAAITLTNRELVVGLESLLRQFVKAIAYALDKKSKYSGYHITRVALLTEMFTEMVNNSDKGIFADIKFDDNQMEEISLAGWLHDIGKIITPEYIMDKAKKLETIYDKVHLIELRFELIQALIENRIIKLDAGQSEKEIDDLKAKSVLLDGYLEFIKKTNIGGEFLKDESIEKLNQIYEFKFIHEGREYRLLTEDELNKLRVRKGTLTAEERKAMEDHAVTTKELLNRLTFPKKFANIPLYASAHHEKLDGSGYPSRLTADHLPISARIVAVADIFEALTAADRPYKEGKKLSQALKIMSFMVKDNHIDKDIYNLLLDSGLYLQYAEKFLKPEQIDEIDVEKFRVD